MYQRKKRPPEKEVELPPLPAARTEEEAEKRAIGLAVDLAIEQLRKGTASSQVITHFLKLGSLKEQAELEKTKHEIELLKAKKKAIESGEEQEKMYQKVIDAIATYNGRDSEWEVVEDDDAVYI